MKRLNFAVALLFAVFPMLHAGDQFPSFSWDRVPVYAHVGKVSGDFTSEQLDFLAEHFDFITIEKHQASHKLVARKLAFR